MEQTQIYKPFSILILVVSCFFHSSHALTLTISDDCFTFCLKCGKKIVIIFTSNPMITSPVQISGH